MELLRELDDHDRVRVELARVVPPVEGRLLLALVPPGERRRPVGLQTLDAALAEVLDEVLGRHAKHGGDGAEVARGRLGEVAAPPLTLADTVDDIL